MFPRFIDLYLAIVDNSISYVPYSGIESGEVDEFQDSLTILRSKVRNPETYTINKNLFEVLSPDAKWLLETICVRPEMVCTPRTGNITKASVRRFLNKKERWHRVKINRTFRDLQQYIDSIE